MAQTTGQMSGVTAKVEISAAGVTFTDISGATNIVDVPEQARMVGEAYTFDGDIAVMSSGKRQPFDITVTIIYTEVASTEPFEVVRALHETADGSPLYLRWSPGGGDGGDFQYSTGAGRLSGFQYPSITANDGNPIVCTFKVRVAGVTKAAVAT